ncbi:FecR domain-containing protein [Rhodoplanes sp. TEM]|uniref:FecR domain-containing protein n=1 Tax=Rhodoplanes tepidamans TaxID=200616 RepID=A0ABT5JBZ9_RHOTP|nr:MULTISPECIES: FecR domain-containing protein [Rhodoplanes]MDC7787012.1 FecR domain-containing protein [Rhodoplanes tepidamans]MDC7987020.1 FecR domain-containing protein [Rhodoplanes sp. TEM]MDQ0354263.1 transmembrane sensor [Rhodoplanes tepidamans]
MTTTPPDRLQRAALDLLVRATSGRATLADLRALEAWRAQSPAHAAAYRSALRAWETAAAAAATAATPADRAMLMAPTRPVLLGRRALLAGGGLAAAAAVVGLAVRPPLDLWPSLSDLRADFRTGTGEQRSVALAEGVSVEMNTRTSIVRRPADSGLGIELIAGEAEIAAAHAVPLTVVAGAGRIVATDAVFNVRRDAARVVVTCLAGGVRVECAGHTAPVTAGRQLAYTEEGSDAAAAVDAATVTAWRRGLLIFHDEPFARIVDEVNRYRPGRIVLLDAELAARRVSARLELGRIDDVIAYAGSVLGAGVRTLPGGVVLLI